MKWAVLIQEALNGKAIQCRKNGGPWLDLLKREAIANMAAEYPSFEFRIKPEPKPDEVLYSFVGTRPTENGSFTLGVVHHTQGMYNKQVFIPGQSAAFGADYTVQDVIRYVYDGETGQLKSVEIVK